MMNKNSKFKKGFSIVEIVVVIAIMGVIAGFVSVSFSAFRNTKLLDSTAEDVLSLVNTARVKSISSENASVHGVHFETDRAVLFAGNVFTEPSASNVEINLSPAMEISSVSLAGGGADIVFERITGETADYGSVIIRSKSDTSKTKTLKIKSAGVAEVE